MSHEWTEDMGEISGFGGDYERSCRAMVLAGIAWIDEHPNADLQIKSYQNVFGVAIPESADAKALEDAIMAATVTMDDGRTVCVKDEATGAMHHAAMQHCYAYQRLGWDEYARQLRGREQRDEATA